MNETEESQLLSLACQALKTCTQLTAQPVALEKQQAQLVTPAGHQANRYLRIGLQEHLFIVEAKSRLQTDTIGQLRVLNDKANAPVVLVVPYVSDQQGKKLRQHDLQYLDTAGNAYLHAAERAFFVLVKGQRKPLAKPPTQHRAFQPAGVQLLYHLLSEPALLQASYRVMAEQAQVALGSVSILLGSLQQLGLLRNESGQRRWTEPAHVLRRWVDAYGEVVRPKLAGQRYRWLDPEVARQGWQHLTLGPGMAWGGEPAAHLLLEGYLLPEHFTLYTTATRGEVMRRLRLVPDATGTVEVLRPMATILGGERLQPQAVHPLLAYADLLLTPDPRNREMAHLLYEHYLPYLA